jgi:FkbM family methyltransferase
MKIQEKIELFSILNKSISKNTGVELVRILKQPINLPFSKLVELMCIFLKLDRKMQAKTFWGEKMNVVFPEIVSCFIYRYGYFEEDLTKIMIEYLNHGDVFMDIGTHFGYYSMLGSHIVGKKGSVHAFEPTLSTYNIAKSNLKKDNIFLNNKAVWSKSDEIIINDYGTQYSAFNSIFKAKLTDDHSKKLKFIPNKVQAVCVDDYVRFNNISPKFIKIDAENAEYEILLGMSNVLNTFRPIISLEVGDFEGEDHSISAISVKYILDKGYSAYEIENGKLRMHYAKQYYSHTNLILLPN